MEDATRDAISAHGGPAGRRAGQLALIVIADRISAGACSHWEYKLNQSLPSYNFNCIDSADFTTIARLRKASTLTTIYFPRPSAFGWPIVSSHSAT